MLNWPNITILKRKSLFRVSQPRNTGMSVSVLQLWSYGDFFPLAHNAAELGRGPRFTVRETPKGSSVMGLTGRRCIPLAPPPRFRAAIFKDAQGRAAGLAFAIRRVLSSTPSFPKFRNRYAAPKRYTILSGESRDWLRSIPNHHVGAPLYE